MAKEIKPSEISRQLDYDIGAATDFAAELLEDVNDHNVSGALTALNVEDYDLACDFIKLEKDQAKAGSLTTELSRRRDALLERLEKAQEEYDAEDAEEKDDDEGDED